MAEMVWKAIGTEGLILKSFVTASWATLVKITNFPPIFIIKVDNCKVLKHIKIASHEYLDLLVLGRLSTKFWPIVPTSFSGKFRWTRPSNVGLPEVPWRSRGQTPERVQRLPGSTQTVLQRNGQQLQSSRYYLTTPNPVLVTNVTLFCWLIRSF